jgi:hypothetical protein
MSGRVSTILWNHFGVGDVGGCLLSILRRLDLPAAEFHIFADRDALP